MTTTLSPGPGDRDVTRQIPASAEPPGARPGLTRSFRARAAERPGGGPGRLLQALGLVLSLALVGLRPAPASVLRLSNNASSDRAPQINHAGQVVWEGRSSVSAATRIYLWNGTSVQPISPVSPDGQDSSNPQINDAGWVTWESGGQVYLWDGSSTRQISNRPVSNVHPRINRTGQVIWKGSDGTNDQIYLWDGAATRQLTQDRLHKGDPEINAQGHVAWLGTDGYVEAQIYLWDGTAIQAVSRVHPYTWGPRLNDADELVWWGQGEDREQVYLWDGAAIRRLTDPSLFGEGARLNPSGQVAWTGPGGIYLWDGLTTRLIPEVSTPVSYLHLNAAGQLTWQTNTCIQYWTGAAVLCLVPNKNGWEPAINDAGQVAWSGWSGSDTEIYLYTPAGPGSLDLLRPSPILEGESAAGLVTLTAPAPPGGAVVTLASDHPSAAGVSDSVTVPEGATTATFTVTTHLVPATTSVLLSASYGGATWTTGLQVWHVALSSLNLPRTSVGGGVKFTGSVTLDSAAPAGGAVVTLESDNPGVLQVAVGVLVKAGETTATFSLQTLPVSSATPVLLTAACGGVTRTAILQVGGVPPLLTNLLLTPSRVLAGGSALGVVSLEGVAPADGAVVTLAADPSGAVEVPASVTVPSGQSTVSFPVRAALLAANCSVTVAASYNSVTRTATLDVVRQPLVSFVVSPPAVTGGGTAAATVTLAEPAPPGGAAIQLGWEPGGWMIQRPPFIVPEGATTATIPLTPQSVQKILPLRISATYGGQTLSAPLTVMSGGLGAIRTDPIRVVGGGSVMGTVTLTEPAPDGGAMVALASDHPEAGTAPPSVTVAAGATTATFPIATAPVAIVTPVFFSAAYAGLTRSTTLTVLPSLPVSLTLQPERITSGLPATGRVTLRDPAPKGGATVMLSSRDPAAGAPTSVTVPAGATEAIFRVTTVPVPSETAVALTAAYQGASHTALLTLLPVAARPPEGSVTRINLATNDIAYDSATGRLYASLPSRAGGIGDSVTWLDPFTGVLGSSVPVGSEPGKLARSDDGRYLYVALDGVAAVRRVDLPSETAGLQFALGSDPVFGSLFGPYYVEDMEVLPGDPEAVAISRQNRTSTPHHEGVAIYDNGVPRPIATQRHTGSNVIEFSGSSAWLYGYDNEGQPYGFRRLAAGPVGVTELDVTPTLIGGVPFDIQTNLIAGAGVDIAFDDGLIYTSSGRVVDPEARVLLGKFPGIPDTWDWLGNPRSVTLVRPDATRNRVFFLTGEGTTRTLLAFDAGRFSLVGSLPISGVLGTASSLIRRGEDGLAFRTSENQLFLIRTPLIPSPPLSVSVAPGSVTGGETTTGTVTLAAPAPAGGLLVTLSSADPAALLPASITVPAGATSAGFPVSTVPVAASRSVVIGASAGTMSAAARLQVLEPILVSLTFDRSRSAGGVAVTGTVTLSGPAPAGGRVVALTSYGSMPVTLPASVTVPAGAATATFDVMLPRVYCATGTTIEASLAGSVRQSDLQILPQINFQLTPEVVVGSEPVTGRVALSCLAPPEGLVIDLASDDPSVAAVPAHVTVAGYSTQVTFPVTTSSVKSLTTVAIRASLGGGTQTATLKLLPVTFSSLDLSASRTQGGTAAIPVIGTVTLAQPAPAGGTVVPLRSDHPEALILPASVTVPEGATHATFTVGTRPVAATTTVRLTAVLGGTTRTATLEVLTASLSAFTLYPNTVDRYRWVTGTVSLTGPTPDSRATVRLSSSNPALIAVPASVTVSLDTASFSAEVAPVAVATSVLLSATYQGETRMATVEVLPLPLAALTLDALAVRGGLTVTGTVTLIGPAPEGGLVVNLTSDRPSVAAVPATLVVPAGATTARFTVATRPVPANTEVVISAPSGSETVSARLRILPPLMAAFSVTPSRIAAGETAMATVTLNSPAPAEGVPVTFSAHGPAAALLPDRVTVPEGSLTASVPIRAASVPTMTAVDLAADVGGTTETATLTVLPPAIGALTLEPACLIQGKRATGTITLTAPAPAGGLRITLASANPRVATVPASVRVPAGIASVTFPVTAQRVRTATAAMIAASAGEANRGGTLEVVPDGIRSVAVQPGSVAGGKPAVGVIALQSPAPPGGAMIALSSGKPGVATVPGSVLVPAGARTVTFPVTTSPTQANAGVTITAAYAGDSRSTRLTVRRR